MKICSIITEYNPFHNGHKYQIEKAREETQADVILCIMSGNFVERGEPASFDKFTRTKMALACGADILVELPTIYATASAEYFSNGAINILNSLNSIDYLVFGTESSDQTLLNTISDILVQEPEKYKSKLKLELNKGLSFPIARSNALKYILADNYSASQIEEIMKEPNNILAIEYLKSLRKTNSLIKPIAIQRVGPSYNSDLIESNLASATAIRNRLLKNDISSIHETIPDNVLSIIKDCLDNGKYPMSYKNFEKEFLYKLRTMSKEQIGLISDVSEGLNSLIINSLSKINTIEAFIECLKSKRYTRTRIQRIITHILLGIENSTLEKYNNAPQYARILGMSSKGKKALSEISKKALIPTFTSVSNFMKHITEEQKEMLELDILASNIYNLGYEIPRLKTINDDYTTALITD